MAKRKCNAGRRLRQLKKSHQQFKQTLGEQLMQFDDLLYNQQQAYIFYSHALLTLTQDDCEPDSWVIGASVIEQQLRMNSESLTNQLQAIRQLTKLH